MPTSGNLFKQFGAKNICRHKIGGKLNSLGTYPECGSKGFYQSSLGDPRRTNQKPVPAGQQHRQY